MSELNVQAVQSQSLNAPVRFEDGAGTEIGRLCRAWVNFNGMGTVAIRASFNVLGITDNGTGRYTVNLTTAMADTNGAVIASGAGTVALPSNNNGSYTAAFSTTSAVLVHTMNPTGNSAFDPEVVTLAIFR